MITFRVDQEKSVEALTYIAQRWPGISRFFICKVLYLAEREHLRRYGRPITGDTMYAMDHGPVPTFAYDVVKGAFKAVVNGALVESAGKPHPEIRAAREPDLSYFSKTDLACLDRAIEHCRPLTFGQLSDETHKHLAWIKAPLNCPMSFDDMLDGVDDAIKNEAEAFSTYGVL